jgi:hypothetical protein
MIYLIYTKNQDVVRNVVEYLNKKHGEVFDLNIDINWGVHEDMSHAITTMYVSDLVNIDVLDFIQSSGVMIEKMDREAYCVAVNKQLDIGDYIPALEHLLDKTAKSYDYDNINDACSYTSSVVEHWKKESLAFSAWRDTLWGTYVENLKTALENSNAPTVEDFVSSIPTYEKFLN